MIESKIICNLCRAQIKELNGVAIYWDNLNPVPRVETLSLVGQQRNIHICDCCLGGVANYLLNKQTPCPSSPAP